MTAGRTPYLSLDLRSLALWRMILGGLVLWDIVLRLRDLQAFYGDHGVYPRELCFQDDLGGGVFQLFYSNGSTTGLLFLFGLGAVAATCLAAGYHTRWAGLATWYFTVSLQLRNPMVLDGGDEVLRVLLFWTPFLPLGARWSVDALRNPGWKNLPNAYRSMATVAVYLQMFLFYLFAALLKSGEDWTETGDALYYVLSIDQFVTRFGSALTQYPDQLRLVTFLALGLEFLLAFLLVVPSRVPYARYLFLALALGFHLAIAALLHLGIFMLVMVGILTVFLPASFWRTSDHDGPIPSELPVAYELSIPLKAFVGFMMFYLVLVNIQSIENRHRLNDFTRLVARYTYEHQHWHFFAPFPFREDGDFVLEIKTKEGEIEDIFQSGFLDTTSGPRTGADRFPNQRWRRWLQNLIQIQHPQVQAWREKTLSYLVGRWNLRYPDREVRTARLVFRQQATPPPGGEPLVEEVLLAEFFAADESRPERSRVPE